MTVDPAAWLRTFHPPAADAVRLICLPHAGGAASFYHSLSQALAPEVATVAVQYPGRQDRYREPSCRSINDLADGVYAALRPSAGERLALFGHSMGAVVAYELAARMRAAGGPDPLALFVSGRRAPSCYRAEAVHRLDDAGVVAQLRLLSGTETSLLDDPELLEVILPAVRDDYRAVETYRHDPATVLGCPITVLTGAHDPMTTLDEAQAWRSHTTARVEVKVYAGGHFFLAEHLTDVAELIRRTLTSAVPG